MDKLKSYDAAKRELRPSAEHRQQRSLNNRCENSHHPPRRRERRMQRFTSPGHVFILGCRTGLPVKAFKCAWFDEQDYCEFFPLPSVYPKRLDR